MRRHWPQRAPYLALAALYLASVVLLFGSRVREFADETDNLLGGVLLVRGERLYTDYFSSHMPLAYYVAAIPAAFGAVRVEDFRPFTNAMLVLATLGIVWAFRRRVSLAVLGLWAVLTLFAHTLQFGEMLTAGTTAGLGTLVAGLLFYTTPGLRFDWRRGLALSVAVFVAIQSALLAAYPLAVLAAAFVWTVAADVFGARLGGSAAKSSFASGRLLRDRLAQTLGLVGLVALPHLLVVAWFWVQGGLGELVYDAVQFNQTYYSQYLMSGSPMQMLHDWEAQYRTYLVLSLAEPLGIQGLLVMANAVAAGLIGRQRGVLVGIAYYAFAALSHIRTEDGYYLVSYLSLAVIGVTSIQGLSKFVLATTANRATRERRDGSPPAASGPKGSEWPKLVASLAGVALVLAFAVRVAGTYDFSRGPARSEPEPAVVTALTQPGDRIFVAPYDPWVYLATNRMPAATSPFYFPWQALDPRTENRLIEDLRQARPPVIVFRQDELVNGQWRPREYGRRVLDALAADGYVTLNEARWPDVLVPRENLDAARRTLQASSLL